MIKTPNFWKNKNLISFLLLPLSLIYISLGYLRNLLITPLKISKPLICIGNLTVGGTGKTPISLKLGEILQELKIDFAYLGHGYKSKNIDVTLIDNKKHNALEVGDEALLLSEVADTFIAKNRVQCALKISNIKNKKLIIMDDGFQNPSLIKDLSILVIDGNYGFGSEMIFPAGPLRQNISKGIKKADLIIINGQDKFNLINRFKDKKVIQSKIIISKKQKIDKKAVIAFCAIGRPEKFFNTLKEANFNIKEEISYVDHYHYKQKDIANLLHLAKKNKANLITTKKDWVKLSDKDRKKIQYLDVEIEFSKKDIEYIKNKLKKLINDKNC